MAKLTIRVWPGGYFTMSCLGWILVSPFLLLFWTAAGLGWLLVMTFRLLGELIAALDRWQRARAQLPPPN